jgi:hypothetical protein
MGKPCALCDSVGTAEKWRGPRYCMTKGADAPATCWLHSSQEEVRLCAESMVTAMKGAARRTMYLHWLRCLGEAFEQGEDAVQNALAGLPPEARATLLKYGTAPFRVMLAKRVAQLDDVDVRQPARSVRIPEGLPLPLCDGLVAFQQRLQARYDTLLQRGHTRSSAYVAEAMKAPIRLAVFLASIGIERWDVVRKRDLVAFFKNSPGVRRQHVERFMRSLEDHRPFRDRRGRPSEKRRGMRNAKRPPPQILRPEVLTQFLADVRERYSAHEYVLAWLVGRLGMRATKAYRISLDRIRLTDNGRMVIRPAQLWVEVPARVANLFRTVIEGVEPSWGRVDPESLQHVTVFDHYIKDLDSFMATVLQGRTLLLRSSAVFAAMFAGHLDRVTLRQSMGVSMPTIIQLERLLSVDLHRRLDPDLVEQRNAHITGEIDG